MTKKREYKFKPGDIIQEAEFIELPHKQYKVLAYDLEDDMILAVAWPSPSLPGLGHSGLSHVKRLRRLSHDIQPHIDKYGNADYTWLANGITELSDNRPKLVRDALREDLLGD